MVVLWFVGDIPKLIFLVSKRNPVQLVASCVFQLCVELLILLQFWAYREKGRPEADESEMASRIEDCGAVAHDHLA